MDDWLAGGRLHGVDGAEPGCVVHCEDGVRCCCRHGLHRQMELAASHTK
jgi:hypothetical protein